MPELAPVCDIIQAEQDADITAEFRLPALSGAAGRRDLRCPGKVPPALLVHAFGVVDVAVDRLLADP